MRRPFGLLIVHGDGSRVVRLTVPRSLAYSAAGLLGLVAAVAAALSGDYLLLRSQAGELFALRAVVSQQRSALEGFRQRVVAVRGEIETWKELHARMWEPYGTGDDPAPETAGLGGPGEAEASSTDTETPGSLDEEFQLLSATVSEEGPRLRELERVMARYARTLAALPVRWPARGPVNSEYGFRANPWGGGKEHHGGMDIGMPSGSPVKAPSSGVVAAAGAGGDYGNHVILDHGSDVRSLYGHLSRVLVRAGDRVEKGQVIGLAGSTGRSTAPHLHYEVRVKGRTVNPRTFLWE